MDSVASVRLFTDDESVADEVGELLYELDNAISAYDGEVHRLNENNGGEMSGHVSELYKASVNLYKETDGKFSPFLGSVIELWGVGSRNYVPTEAETEEALSATEVENIVAYGNCIELKKGMKLNFGAVAKGYAADVLRKKLLERNVEGAVISLGGNIYVHGKKKSGGAWNVALRDPCGDENDWFAMLSLSDCFVISSGDYERFFERDGKRYHHIMDPKTGKPCESDITSVTVVCDNGTRGDAYSTALYVMGKEGALSFWRENEGFELVIVDREGRVTVTEGLSDKLVPNEEKGYTYETAHR